MASLISVRTCSGFAQPFQGLTRSAWAPAQVRALPSGTGRRTFSAVCSTAEPDRVGNVVMLDGWELDHFRWSGGPVYWEHETTVAPVARCKYLAVDPAVGLVAEGEFPERGRYELADEVWNVLEQGLVEHVSVRFLPIEVEPLATGGRLFKRQQLTELSFCRKPANAGARILRLHS
jgi:hypothetical protein